MTYNLILFKNKGIFNILLVTCVIIGLLSLNQLKALLESHRNIDMMQYEYSDTDDFPLPGNLRVDPNMIKFVIPKRKTNATCKSTLITAFKECQAANISCRWIDEYDLYVRSPPHPNEIFVIDPFEGKYFEYLKRKQCHSKNFSILGPLVISYVIKHQSLMYQFPYPVHNMNMFDLKIFITNSVLTTKGLLYLKSITTRIKGMGGNICFDYGSEITHVLACSMYDPTCRRAGMDKKIILGVGWVEEIWSISLDDKFENASDQIFIDAWKLLPLTGVYLYVRGGDGNPMTERLKTLINGYGGTCCDHLNYQQLANIIVNIKGCECDSSEQIPCVRSEWITACIYTKYFYEINNYINDKHCSIVKENKQYNHQYVICPTRFQPKHYEMLKDLQLLHNVQCTSSWAKNITHVVADLDCDDNVPITMKTLMGLASNKTVVAVNWIEECHSKKQMIKTDMYVTFPSEQDIANDAQQPFMTKIFENLTFRFQLTSNKIFGSYSELKWMDLIRILGGVIVGHDDEGIETDYFIYKSDCCDSICSSKYKFKKKISWIIECIFEYKLLS